MKKQKKIKDVKMAKLPSPKNVIGNIKKALDKLKQFLIPRLS